MRSIRSLLLEWTIPALLAVAFVLILNHAYVRSQRTALITQEQVLLDYLALDIAAGQAPSTASTEYYSIVEVTPRREPPTPNFLKPGICELLLRQAQQPGRARPRVQSEVWSKAPTVRRAAHSRREITGQSEAGSN